MNKLKTKKIKTALDYFDYLHQTLQHYEGDSLYFAPQNALFIAFLQAKYLFLNVALKDEVLNKLHMDAAYNAHPFLLTTIKIIENVYVSRKEKQAVLTKLENHPLYPLKAFLTKTLKKQKISKSSGDLLLLYALSHPEQIHKATNCQEIVAALTARNHPYIISELLKPYREENNYNKVFDLLHSLTPYYVSNRNAFQIEVLRSLVTKEQFNSPFAVKTMQKRISLGDNDAYLELVNYYEQEESLGERRFTLAFYYLSVAAAKNIKDAKKRLASYYEKGITLKAIPEIINKLND